MGTIQAGTGLISGINTASLIDSLISIDAQPQTLLKNQVQLLTAQQTAFAAVNAKLLGLKLSTAALTDVNGFRTTAANSSDQSVLTATSGATAPPGTYSLGRWTTASTPTASCPPFRKSIGFPGSIVRRSSCASSKVDRSNRWRGSYDGR